MSERVPIPEASPPGEGGSAGGVRRDRCTCATPVSVDEGGARSVPVGGDPTGGPSAPAGAGNVHGAVSPPATAVAHGAVGIFPVTDPAVGVGPWPGGRGSWPDDPRLDPGLLELGDRRNVEDRYRYWRMDAIREDLGRRSRGFEVAVENLNHDFNIGSIVRTANALGATRVHIVGKRRWNRRGAMVTDRYLEVDHLPDAAALQEEARARGLCVVGIDNVPGSEPLEEAVMPEKAVMVFGEESGGLSPDMLQVCDRVLHITQYGSTRSMNVGHAAAIAMWAWVTRGR